MAPPLHPVVLAASLLGTVLLAPRTAAFSPGGVVQAPHVRVRFAAASSPPVGRVVEPPVPLLRRSRLPAQMSGPQQADAAPGNSTPSGDGDGDASSPGGSRNAPTIVGMWAAEADLLEAESRETNDFRQTHAMTGAQKMLRSMRDNLAKGTPENAFGLVVNGTMAAIATVTFRDRLEIMGKGANRAVAHIDGLVAAPGLGGRQGLETELVGKLLQWSSGHGRSFITVDTASVDINDYYGPLGFALDYDDIVKQDLFRNEIYEELEELTGPPKGRLVALGMESAQPTRGKR